MRVPFPHVERPVLVPRPALVIARRDTEAVGALLWTLMVTNAERPSWAGDVAIPDSAALGLLIPSKVRTAKVSSAEEASAKLIGRLPLHTWREVMTLVEQAFRT